MNEGQGFDVEAADTTGADDGDDAIEAVAPRPQMSRKAFLERAAARADGRKPDVRKGIDAALATLAEALAEGRDLNLPPLGRLRVTRQKDNGKARVLTLRLTVPKAQALADGPLADGSEDD